MAATVNLAYLQEVWAEILTAVFPIATLPKVHLFTNSPTLQPGMVVAAFTEATFSGYAATAIAGLLASTTPGNTQVVTYPTGVVTFTFTGSGTGTTVNGYYITDHANNLVSAEYFPDPVPLSVTNDSVSFLPGFGIGPFSASIIMVP